jgi:hypothetical protein
MLGRGQRPHDERTESYQWHRSLYWTPRTALLRGELKRDVRAHDVAGIHLRQQLAQGAPQHGVAQCGGQVTQGAQREGPLGQPGVRFAGLVHPGLIGCLPSKKLLADWNERESALYQTDPERVPAVATLPQADTAHMGRMSGGAMDAAAAEGARTVPPRVGVLSRARASR